jgi:hypothetical protein
MSSGNKSKHAIEFGDFQTPIVLARDVCRLLASQGISPASIVEPTCGRGKFLIAALEQFPQSRKAVGIDVSSAHVKAARSAIRRRPLSSRARIIRGDFFQTDWPALLRDLPEPWLVIGNPPWVTNAEIGVLGGSNLPAKSNFQKHTGLDAMTGKSNFDISEWILMRILDWLRGRNATVAMLCKTAVARKVLMYGWKNKATMESSQIYRIDAVEHFGASVEACLLVCHMAPSGGSLGAAPQKSGAELARARAGPSPAWSSCEMAPRHGELTGPGTARLGCQSTPHLWGAALGCSVYEALSEAKPAHEIGYRDGQLVAEVSLYDRWKHLRGEERYRWRSGIKHDCAKVMELRREGDLYRNGLRELVEIEDDYLFPMLKSSDVANGSVDRRDRWMLVTQTAVGDDTGSIQSRAPKTWRYLHDHADRLDRRASAIYRGRPRFSIFGVGPYSFAPWKVAISGLYKRLEFRIIGSSEGKPVVLDDTVYFVSCESKAEAEYVASLLNSPAAREFYEALVFWDAKRPITVQLLRELDLLELARELGTEATLTGYPPQYPAPVGAVESSRGLHEALNSL